MDSQGPNKPSGPKWAQWPQMGPSGPKWAQSAQRAHRPMAQGPSAHGPRPIGPKGPLGSPGESPPGIPLDPLKSLFFKNRFFKKDIQVNNYIFRRQRPDAFLTDRGHRGFEFFAHRSCPATQGSTFRARSARRVREIVKCAKT